MPPSPTGTADCMAWPRVFRSRAVSARREGAGGAERGIFAQAVAGDQISVLGDVQPHLLFQHAQHRHGCGHDGGLGIFGERQIGFRALPTSASTASGRARHRLPGRPRGRARRHRQGPCPCRPSGCPGRGKERLWSSGGETNQEGHLKSRPVSRFRNSHGLHIGTGRISESKDTGKLLISRVVRFRRSPKGQISMHLRTSKPRP